MVLTCYFAPSLQTSLPGPPSAPPPLPVRPGTGRFLASSPLQFCLPLRLAASPVSTPLWGFYSPSDQSVLPDPLPVGSPSESARSPLAPRCRSFFKCGYGSTFQVRYVSGGLLFLKPLGTSLTMLLPGFSVNPFSRFYQRFPQHLFALFRTGYRQIHVTILWINHRSTCLFYFNRRIMPFSVASQRLFSSGADNVTCRATAR